MTATALLDAYAVTTAPDAIRIERILPGPIERVWSYLTDSALRRQWLAAGDMELRAGAPFILTWRNDELTNPSGTRPDGMSEESSAECRLVTVDAPHSMSWEWPDVGLVTVTLAAQADEVLLTLTHARAPNARTARGVSFGWHAHLDVLDAKLCGQHPLPFWENFVRLRAEYEARMPI